MIFLLQYDRKQGTVRKLKSFPFAARAEAQRERLKIELSLHKTRVPDEVVLLEAADEQTLKRTHQRYFKTPRELVESMSPS
jgi:hypothetical protein